MNIPNPLSKGAPPAPDYAGAARQDTMTNRPNQNTPWASSRWSQGPTPAGPASDGSMFGNVASRAQAPAGGGQWTQDVSLAPGLQSANDSMMSQLGSAWANPLDNGAQARQHAEDAIYGRAASRLDPMWSSREHDMQTQLANQGIDPNSAAYTKASSDFGRNRNDAYSSALMDAIMGGGQEASRQQGMDLTSRMAPLGAMGSLRNLTQMPGFQGGGSQLQAANMAGQYGMDAAKMDQGFWNDLVGGGMDLAKSIKNGGWKKVG